MPSKLAAGNWKMNGLKASLAELDPIAKTARATSVPTLICPPATLLTAATTPGLHLGGQTCHTANSGAHTGDISAPMLRDAGASHVIVGHSERRSNHAETNADVAAQARAAWDAGLIPVVCIGETLAEREAGTYLAILATQLHESLPDGATAANTIVAYEPVWAIGTGRVAEVAQIIEVHDALRTDLVARFPQGIDFTILYGGSVKAGNAAEIFACTNVNGALVGGASLTASDFCPIIEALGAS
jgi:triosephosphate isomerase